MSFHLSKSRFTTCVQCPKMMWLKQNRPELMDSAAMNEAVLTAGNEVGDLAMGLFGEYTEVPFDKNVSKMVKTTSELLKEGTKVIAEASFASKDGFCSVDILINKGNNVVEFYEVKSSTKVNDIYRYDIAYQYHILKQCGFDVTQASLVHINSKYVRHGEIDIHELFEIEDLTETAIGLQSEVEERISNIMEYMKQTEEPNDDIGPQCFNPYDCGFWSHCTENLPRPNVFDIYGMQKRTMFKHYRASVISFEDAMEKNVLNDNQALQVKHELNKLPPYINKEVIQETLDKLSYPLYFLDFESFNPAIPLYDNSWPYEQVIFQYSLHYIEEEGGELKHKEYLAYPNEDPRRGLLEKLCEDIPLDACTTVYNISFERTRLKEMAQLYPDLADHLNNIIDHMVDLMVPFQKKSFYCKEMQGRYTIKYVLPALFPNDPELDYHNLEGVHDGGEASDTFKRMATMEPEELARYRSYLLKYCGLDTYAMVKVWEKLCEAGK